MTGRLLKVLFVDDELDPETPVRTAYEELNELVQLLRATQLVDVQVFTSYRNLGTTPEEKARTVNEFDLLILDVLMEDGTDYRSFYDTLAIIGRLRPFLIYTMLPGDTEFNEGPTWLSLADDVYKMGCLRIITKPSGKIEPERRKVYHDLVENVLWYYWCTIGPAGGGRGIAVPLEE